MPQTTTRGPVTLETSSLQLASCDELEALAKATLPQLRADRGLVMIGGGGSPTMPFSLNDLDKLVGRTSLDAAVVADIGGHVGKMVGEAVTSTGMTSLVRGRGGNGEDDSFG